MCCLVLSSSLSPVVVWSVRQHSLTACAARHEGAVAALLMHFTSTWASLATTHRSLSNSSVSRRPSATASASASAVVGSVELTRSAATCSTLPIASLPTADAQAELGPTLALTFTFNSFCSSGSQFCYVELAGTLFCAYCRTSAGPDEEVATIAQTESTENGVFSNTHLHLNFYTV